MSQTIHPNSTAAEIGAFLYNINNNVYDPSKTSMTEADQLLACQRRKDPPPAGQALLSLNIYRRQILWHWPYSFGIADITMHDVIDLDKAGIFL